MSNDARSSLINCRAGIPTCQKLARPGRRERLPYNFRRRSIKPVHRGENAAELFVIDGKSRKPFTNWLAFPPGWITGRREMIAIELRANVVRRSNGKWITGEKGERGRIVMQ